MFFKYFCFDIHGAYLSTIYPMTLGIIEMLSDLRTVERVSRDGNPSGTSLLK